MKSPCFYGYRPEECTDGHPRVSPATAVVREGVDDVTGKRDETKTALVRRYILWV